MTTGDFDYASRSHVGCQRELNEDAILESPTRGLWAVADGMGGHEAGEVASRIVVEALSEATFVGEQSQYVSTIQMALDFANSKLRDLSKGQFGGRTIGSTVVGLVLSGERFTCFWAGDSRAYRIRDGAIERLSKDHSMIQDLVDAGMLNEADADAHPNANVITRAVGVADELELEIRSGEARSGDVFILASDGLTRLIPDGELLNSIRFPPPEDADRLLETALARGAPDNVSFVLVRVN